MSAHTPPSSELNDLQPVTLRCGCELSYDADEGMPGITYCHTHGAAPELLAALRAIVFQVIQGKVLERDACITEARAAIQKAEGKP